MQLNTFSPWKHSDFLGMQLDAAKPSKERAAPAARCTLIPGMQLNPRKSRPPHSSYIVFSGSYNLQRAGAPALPVYMCIPVQLNLRTFGKEIRPLSAWMQLSQKSAGAAFRLGFLALKPSAFPFLSISGRDARGAEGSGAEAHEQRPLCNLMT